MIDFTDQAVAGTGAGRGLGRMSALDLAKRGASVDSRALVAEWVNKFRLRRPIDSLDVLDTSTSLGRAGGRTRAHDAHAVDVIAKLSENKNMFRR